MIHHLASGRIEAEARQDRHKLQSWAITLVTFEGSTAIGEDIMRSTSTLRFRERNELE